MKIKRFVAPDMRTVLRRVREEQGPDAVILSNRSIEGGVEVVTATDYDEQLAQDALKSLLPQKPTTALDAARETDPALPRRFAEALRSNASSEAARPSAGSAVAVHPSATTASPPEAATIATALVEPASASSRRADFSAFLSEAKERLARATAPAPMPAATPGPSLAPAKPATPAAAAPTVAAAAPRAPLPPPPARPQTVRIAPWDEDPSLAEVRAELVAMRGMMEREMLRMNDERLRSSPGRAAALDALTGYGCEESLAREVVAKIPADADPGRARGLMLGQLARLLPIVDLDPLRRPGVVALVGPTGAGKTTTVAKLAARHAAEHGAREVALITTDLRRPGGREQLHAYGREFGLSVVEAGTEEALHAALHRLRDYPLVLIDTAGHGARDRAMVGQLNWLRHAGKVRTMLVMPANAHNADLDEVVRRFGFIAPEAAILTKLDETGRLGAALSVLVRHRLPLAWTTDGQSVPEDIDGADASHLVLKLEELRRAGDRPSVTVEDVDAA